MGSTMIKQDLIIVAAREGSKGLVAKNKLLFDGVPLYLRTLSQALRISKNVIFSTDDKEMLEGCSDLRNLILIDRPKHLSQANSPKLPVLRHALEFYLREYNLKPDLIIDLQTTSPLRLDSEVLGAYETLKKGSKYQNLVSITKSIYHPSYNLVSIDTKNRASLLETKKTITGREMLSNNYYLNGSIFIWRNSEIIKNKNGLIREETLGYETSEITSKDIDSELDFITAESVFKSSFYKNFISS